MQSTQIRPVESKDADANVKKLYQGIEAKMHILPNIFKSMGNSEVALKGFLELGEAANRTSLSPQLREKIALTIGQANNCQYCLSAHTLGAKLTGMPEKDIMQARKAAAEIPKENAILNFAKKVVEKKAHIEESDMAQLRAAGITDKEIVEIILVIMVNMYTNYFNIITGTQIDFPLAPALK